MKYTHFKVLLIAANLSSNICLLYLLLSIEIYGSIRLFEASQLLIGLECAVCTGIITATSIWLIKILWRTIF
jgi:hypothetical protein